MNHSERSSFIWGTADLLRSSFKQHEYGDIILPFTVISEAVTGKFKVPRLTQCRGYVFG